MLDYKILKAKDVNDSHFTNWEKLSENSIANNPVYEKWLLLPALKNLADDNVHVIFIYNNNDLVGIWPVTLQKKWFGQSVVRSWVHDHGFLGNPLINKDLRETILDFLIKISLSYFNVNSISFNLYPHHPNDEKPCTENYLSTKRKLYTRPFMSNTHTFDNHIKNYSDKKLKKQKRLIKLIRNNGFTYRTSSTDHPLDYWKQRFFNLENKGWKGKQNTSIISSHSVSKYYDEALEYAWQHNLVEFQEVYNNDTIIAGAFRWKSGNHNYEVKIAYDEKYSKLSPGMFLEYKNVEDFLNGKMKTMDSCANYELVPLQRLWLDSVTLYEHSFFTKSITGYFSKTILENKTKAKSLVKKIISH